MTWNIWHGGIHGDKQSNFQKDSSNTLNTFQVITENNPDILLMQETYCCGMEIAKKAGFQYSFRSSSNLSIHSNFPFVDTIKIFNPFNSQGAVIKVNEKKLAIFNVWLNYLPDYFNNSKTLSADELIAAELPTRVKEITSILREVDSVCSTLKIDHVIIGGDFNSGSHLDWIESTKAYHNDKIVQWPVSITLKNFNYKDSFREENPDPFEVPGFTWGGFLFDNIISDRIDYLYYRGDGIKVDTSQIISENNSGGFFNSDHRSVMTHFNIE